ncbi:MAG: hypothetical protein K2Q03_05760 [Sphingobacteriaceae bacterium]|nr:hypothetical protein [Sphingobacteriaceae bacterium]
MYDLDLLIKGLLFPAIGLLLTWYGYYIGSKKRALENEKLEADIVNTYKSIAKDLTEEVKSLRQEIKDLRDEIHLYKTGKKQKAV